MRLRRKAIAALLLFTPALIGGAAAQGSATTHPHARVPLATTARKLVLSKRGVPVLNGLNIPLATSAGHAGDEDTLGYIVTQTLKQWGANATLTLGQSPTGEEAVLSGSIDAANSDMPTIINLPLEIFMANQSHQDYVFASWDFTNLSQMKGKNIGIGSNTSPDFYLMPSLLKKAGLTSSQITYTSAGGGGSSAVATLLATKRVDAAWIHVSNLTKVRTSDPNLVVLARAATLLPTIADSWWGAQPSWLASHPAIAEALCLAYIHAVKVFNNQASQWVSFAEAYTTNADPVSQVTADRKAFSYPDLWPFSQNNLSPSTIAANYKFYKDAGDLNGAGVRSLSKVADYTPWNDAWTVYEAHPRAY